MKITHNINISGLLFHVDEDAFVKLNRYLERLRKHFGIAEGSEEIIQDIESRIAELLAQRIHEGKQVIIPEDVDWIIRTMGQPDEFEGSENQEQQTEESQKTEKRFYRDPERRYLGGICAGVAAYFSVDPIWFRILFLLTIFAGGFGIIIYIILWAVIPEAKTTAEKLEMKGKKVTIASIEKSIQEEVGTIRGKLGKLVEGNETQWTKFSKSTRTLLDGLIRISVMILKFFINVLLIVTGLILVLTGFFIFTALLLFLFGLDGVLFIDGGASIPLFPEFARLILGHSADLMVIKLIILIIIGLPLIMLFYNGLRLLFKFNRIKNLGLIVFNIWIIGMIIGAFFAVRVNKLVRYSDTKIEVIKTDTTYSDTLTVAYFHPRPEAIGEVMDIFEGSGLVWGKDDKFYLLPEVSIHRSDNNQFSVKKTISSFGSSKKEIAGHIDGMNIKVAIHHDSLQVSSFYPISQNDRWRFEDIDIEIEIPEGKYVKLGPGRWRLPGFYQHGNLSYLFFRQIDLDSNKIVKMTPDGLEGFEFPF